MKQPSVTVILPTYNEAENIVPLIQEIQKYVPTTTSILVVDDNSPDGTAERVQEFIKTHENKTQVNLLLRTANRGLTNSLRDGIATTQTDLVSWMDCDFSHPPSVIPKLLHAIKRGADIAIATRFPKQKTGQPPHHGGVDTVVQSSLSTVLNRLLSRLLGSGITDYTTGFLATRREVLERIPLRGNYGEYCIDLLVRAQMAGLRIVEIPYVSPPRRFGESKTAPNIRILLRHGFGYVTTLLRLLWMRKFNYKAS